MPNNLKNTNFLLGGDVSFSKSKEIHNAIYKQLNLDLEYEALSFDHENELSIFLENNPEIICNVTYPYKQFCFNYFKNISQADSASQFCRACNLVVKGKHIFNLDGEGFYEFLNINNISLADKKVLICGTGASAKSIYFAIKDKGVKEINFVSRKPIGVKDLDENIYTYAEANHKLHSFDIIVDARPLSFEENLLKFEKPNSNQIIIDISYSDKDTGIITLAKSLNLQCFDGRGMLICQAVLCIQEILKSFSIDNANAKDFKKLYNIGAQAIAY